MLRKGVKLESASKLAYCYLSTQKNEILAIELLEYASFLVKSAKTQVQELELKIFTPYLNEKGIKTEIVFIPNSFVQRMKLFNKCRKYDIVVLQKRLFSWFEFYELRKNSKILAFDFDDAVYMKNRSPSANFADYNSSTRQKRFKRIIKSVDFVITANKTLAKKGEEFSEKSNIYIIPSVASSVGMNVEEADNENGALLANDCDEFIEKINLLLKPESCDLRKSLGEHGRKIIETLYSQKIVGEQFSKMFLERL